VTVAENEMGVDQYTSARNSNVLTFKQGDV